MLNTKNKLIKVKTPSISSPRSPSSTPATARIPSPAKATPRRNPQRTKAAPRRSPSPVAARRRSPSPVAAPRRSPSPVAAPRRSPSPVAARRRSPSPVAAPRRSPSPVAARRRSPSQRMLKDPFSTPFWHPSSYSVPAKMVIHSTEPLPGTLAKQKLFIEDLKKILIIEKIIDRDNPLFINLLAEQQEWNHRFYKLKPYNIVCFIKCDYYQHDKKAPRVFHRNNAPDPFFGNFKFLKLLEKNRMGVKRLNNNILYIHKNRF